MSSQPLWSSTNTSMFSDVFNVPPGNVCLLFATGFEKYKYRTDNTEPVSSQCVCVRRLLHEFDTESVKKFAGCDWVYSVKDARAVNIADELVATCGAPWQLTLCRNLGIIGVPGTYRLELNDATAIGTAQVYAELYGIHDFPAQVKEMFFA